MVQILVTLLVAGVSQWAFSAVADTGEEKEVKAHVIVLCDDDGKDINITTTGDAEGKSFVWVSDDAERGDGRSEGGSSKRIIKRIRLGHGDADRGWLGVSIGEVSSALASQLNLHGRGIMVLNVVSDSPADRGGIEAHDVVIAIDGKELDGNVRQAVELIGENKPGDEVTIKAVREGKEQVFTVTLAAREDMPDFEWKMKMPPLAEIEEEIQTRGCIVRRGAGGEWLFEDLGDLTVLEDLPENILQFIPKAGTRTIHVSGEDSKKTIRCTVQRDGNAIVIEQEDDGEIVVHRTDEDGNESTKTYANADELREADPEAFELFDNARQAVVVHLEFDGLPDLPDLPNLPDIDIDVDLGDLEGHLDEWRTNLSEGLENFEQHMEQFHDFMEQWKEGRGSHSFPIPFIAGQLTGKPRHTFEVRTDGTIEARIRRDDSELVRLYENDSDFEQRNPELFKKYQDLIAVEE